MGRSNALFVTVPGVSVAAGCLSRTSGRIGPGAQPAIASIQDVVLLSCTPLAAARQLQIAYLDGGFKVKDL